MFISATNKELPNCPFLYDQHMLIAYPVVHSSNINFDSMSKKLKNIIKKHVKVECPQTTEFEYFVNIQLIDDIEKEIYVSCHTWLILALNPNIKILPQGINISSNFQAGLFPIHATIKEVCEGNVQCVKTFDTYKKIRQGVGINEMTSEYAKITNLNKKLNLLPSNSCNFILKSNDYPVNSFFSAITNPTVYIMENKNYITHTKQISKTAITLHITISKNDLHNINEIIGYVNNTFGLNIIF